MVVDPLHHYHNFTPPPPAPTFEPTEEEFKDPLAYINKIRPIARNYGVIKIKPPPSWQPPFVIDVSKFEFNARVQKLNEVEAISRVRLAFLNKLANFWHLQGSVLSVPAIDNKWIDLHSLHKAVKTESGYDSCCAKKRWQAVAKVMGFKQSNASTLENHYKKILLPYDIYESGIALKHIQGETPEKSDAKTETKPTVQMGRLAQASKRLMTPRELRNLAFSGPGPKAAVVKEEPVRSDAKTETKPTVQMGRLAQASKRLMTPRELRNLAFSGPGPKAAVVKEEPVRSDAKTETKPTVQMGRLAQASKRLMTPRELRNLAFSGPGPKAAVVKEEPVVTPAEYIA